MTHTFRLSISKRMNNDNLYDSIETLFIKNNFLVARKDKYLTFKKKSSNDYNPKLQILVDLFRSFPQGKIYYDNDSAKILICKINYIKQLVLSAILGLLVSFIFAFMQGDLWMLMLKVGLPITVLLFIIGILIGNSQVKKLLERAIND
ncbi:MAG: hypothetical protein M1445_11840 [Bacteroidetes bacterium]|nr:hypothetical protein [Bacteroidota bacterium]